MGISISELLCIVVVALIVLGPLEMMRLARTIGFLIGKCHRYWYSMSYQFNQELYRQEEAERGMRPRVDKDGSE